MKERLTVHPDQFKRMTTEEMRGALLLDELFQPGVIEMTYVEVDRAIIGSAVPLGEPLKLEASKKEMAADYFTERREVGVMNIGGNGTVTADGLEHKLELKDMLYIGRGTKEIVFRSDDVKIPARFYIVSYPAHARYETALVKWADAEKVELGTQADANVRKLYRYIHLNGARSCQLVMGFTELMEGSVWNTMPVHTHQRRSEIYMYFQIPDDKMVIHLAGSPEETRHIIVREGQAVISPSWSVHSGAGTKNYAFVWSMGGENQVFDDMDWVEMKKFK